MKEHRVIFCTTHEGKKSIIRQLSAELHIETEPEIVTALQRFMNKFHLIKTARHRDAVAKVAKELTGKVVAFKSAEAYAQKLLPSLQQAQ